MRELEIDVIGSMLVNQSVKPGVLRDLQPADIQNKNFRHIYAQMLDSRDRMFNIDSMALLDNNIARNKYILNLMNDCVDVDIKGKCEFLVGKSIKAKS